MQSCLIAFYPQQNFLPQNFTTARLESVFSNPAAAVHALLTPREITIVNEADSWTLLVESESEGGIPIMVIFVLFFLFNVTYFATLGIIKANFVALF